MVDKKHIDNYINQALKPTVSDPAEHVVSAAEKSNTLKAIAIGWFNGEGKGCELPEFSCLEGRPEMIFNDNGSADEIEFYLTEKGEEAGFFVEPIDIVNATLGAQEELKLKAH